LAKNKGM